MPVTPVFPRFARNRLFFTGIFILLFPAQATVFAADVTPIKLSCFIYNPQNPEIKGEDLPLLLEGEQAMTSAVFDYGFFEYILSPGKYQNFLNACIELYHGEPWLIPVAHIRRLTGTRISEKAPSLWKPSTYLPEISRFVGTAASGAPEPSGLFSYAWNSFSSTPFGELLTFLGDGSSLQEVIPRIKKLKNGMYREEFHTLTRFYGIYTYKFAGETEIAENGVPWPVPDYWERYFQKEHESILSDASGLLHFFSERIEDIRHVSPSLDFLSPQTLLDMNRMRIRVAERDGTVSYDSDDYASPEKSEVTNQSYSFRPAVEIFRLFSQGVDSNLTDQLSEREASIIRNISWLLHSRTQGFDSPWPLYSQEVILPCEDKILFSMANVGKSIHEFVPDSDPESPFLNVKSSVLIGLKIPGQIVSDSHRIGRFLQTRSLRMNMLTGEVSDRLYLVKKLR